MKIHDYYLITFVVQLEVESKSIRESMTLVIRAKPMLNIKESNLGTPEFFCPGLDLEKDEDGEEAGICDLRSQLGKVAIYIGEKKHKLIEGVTAAKVSVKKIQPCLDYHKAETSPECKHTVVLFNLFVG